MLKKVFRPFWSYDILKTESWLSQMSSQGWHLVGLKHLTLTFIFEAGEPLQITYRICYEPAWYGHIPPQLQEDGWEAVFSRNNFFIFRTLVQDTKSAPSYEGVYDKNRKRKVIAGFLLLGSVLLYHIGYVFYIFSAVFSSLLLGYTELEISSSVPLPDDIAQLTVIILSVPLLLVLALLVLSVITYIKLSLSNKRLEPLCPIFKEHMSRAQERSLLRSGKLLKKLHLAWFHAPDILEQWLYKMADKGLRLYRVNKLGNSFYFIKDDTHSMRYVVDYQVDTPPLYIKSNTEAGWKLIFKSLLSSNAYYIWSKELSGAEDEAVFYGNEPQNLIKVKNYTLLNWILVLIACALFTFNVLVTLSKNNIEGSDYFLLIMNCILILEFVFFGIRSFGYYRRLKAKLKAQKPRE